jgi:hypothetical protein
MMKNPENEMGGSRGGDFPNISGKIAGGESHLYRRVKP